MDNLTKANTERTVVACEIELEIEIEELERRMVAFSPVSAQANGSGSSRV